MFAVRGSPSLFRGRILLSEAPTGTNSNKQAPPFCRTLAGNVASGTSDSFQTDGGQAEASLKLEMNDNKDFAGPFEASLQGLDLDIDPIKMSLNGRAESQVFVSLKRKSLP